jgi:hypothetical protein
MGHKGGEAAGLGLNGGAAANGASPPHASDQQAESEPLYRQRFGQTGFQHASIFAKFTYTFVSPLVSLGWRGKVSGKGCRLIWLLHMHAC